MDKTEFSLTLDYYLYSKIRTKGMATATKTFVLEHAAMIATDNELLSVNYYDRYGKLIQVVADNHLGGKDIHSSNYNFTGDVIETKTDHQVPGNSMEVYNTYAYDKAKRLQWKKSLVTGDPDSVTLQKSVYDELGRLKRKYLHGDETGALQTVDYTYNIRDWLIGIYDPENVSNTQGSDYFGMSLGYTSGDNPQYNGNISEMYWATGSFNASGYQFDYDGANRLTEAMFTGTGQHNTSYSYDKNGNILTLTRQGQFGSGPESGMIDNLSYTYNGNQLIAVQDLQYTNYQSNGFSDNGMFEQIEYLYDFNGNMIEDSNKRLTVNRYNYLNLPEEMLMATNGLNTISYLYDATGAKLCKHVMHERLVEHTTDYCGSIIYEDGELQYLLTSEGRVVFNPDGTHEYQYFLKDHLGNTRVTFGEDGIIQEDSYYPFGMAMAGLSDATGMDLPNKYLYNGKELQDDYGLDWYDYGARMYDPALTRFYVLDPHAENYAPQSPYVYAANNPIKNIESNGEFPIAIPILIGVYDAMVAITAASTVTAVGVTAYQLNQDHRAGWNNQQRQQRRQNQNQIQAQNNIQNSIQNNINGNYPKRSPQGLFPTLFLSIAGGQLAWDYLTNPNPSKDPYEVDTDNNESKSSSDSQNASNENTELSIQNGDEGSDDNGIDVILGEHLSRTNPDYWNNGLTEQQRNGYNNDRIIRFQQYLLESANNQEEQEKDNEDQK